MRGKVPILSQGALCQGITPAYAGKSRGIPPFWRSTQDHPRLCGEKETLHDLTRVGAGSPPPMRGKVIVLVKFSNFLWITPAYAGKSGNVGESGFYRRDHPRLCGEKHALLIIADRL